MADTTHVEFDTPTGKAYGLYEEFPLNGGDVVDCLVVQPEDGSQPTRVKMDSPEADELRRRFPDLANVKAPAKDAPAAA